MISSLRGLVLSATDSTVIIEVAGVGYRVAVTPRHSRTLRIGHEALLSTVLIVREDSLSLYGFENTEEQELFDLLLGVSGVGPKSALGVLGDLTPQQIAEAVTREDDAPFRKVSGIGPKTAKLIVVQLAGKLIATRLVSAGGSAARAAGAPQLGDQLVSALMGLGWSERIAAPVAEEILAEAGEETSIPVLLRRALSQLGPRGQEVGR